jgi:hypothetical protein
MIAVRMVQASIDQIINMIPVGNGLMAAARAMPMLGLMSRSSMLWIAPIGICRANFNHVFFGAPVVNMLQMTVVEIIDVVLVTNGNMTTSRTVHMRLIGGGHVSSFRGCCGSPRHDRQYLRQDRGCSEYHRVAFRHAPGCFLWGTNLLNLSFYGYPGKVPNEPKPQALRQVSFGQFFGRSGISSCQGRGSQYPSASSFIMSISQYISTRTSSGLR